MLSYSILCNRSSSITDILENAAKQYSVDIKCGARVTSIKSMPLQSIPEPSGILSIPLPENLDPSESTQSSVLSNSNSKSKGKNLTKLSPLGPVINSQFIVTYVTSTSAIFDTVKNSKVENKKIENDDGDDLEDGEDNTRVKEEKRIVCDKVIFATGGSR